MEVLKSLRPCDSCIKRRVNVNVRSARAGAMGAKLLQLMQLVTHTVSPARETRSVLAESRGGGVTVLQLTNSTVHALNTANEVSRSVSCHVGQSQSQSQRPTVKHGLVSERGQHKR